MESNLRRFFLVRAIYNSMFFLPIWVIFVQDKHGLSLPQVTLLDSAFWLTMALTEIPTGAVADTFGRKWSIALGIGLSMLGNLSFGLAGTYSLLLVANSLWAIAVTFLSGADMAFLYDTLRAVGRAEEYPRFRGFVVGVDVIAIGLSGLAGGFLYAWLPEAPFLLYSGLLGIALLVVLTFREPARETDPETGHSPGYRQVLAVARETIRLRPQLRFLLVYSNFLPVAVSLIEITLIQPYVTGIGMPVTSVGIILLALRIAHVLGSTSSAGLAGRLGDRRLFRAAPLAMAAGVIGLGLLPNAAGLALFGLAGFAVAAARPLVETRMLTEIPGSVRATILSVDSLIFRLLLGVVSPLSGLVAGASSLSIAFVALGATALGVLAAAIRLRERRIGDGT